MIRFSEKLLETVAKGEFSVMEASWIFDGEYDYLIVPYGYSVFAPKTPNSWGFAARRGGFFWNRKTFAKLTRRNKMVPLTQYDCDILFEAYTLALEIEKKRKEDRDRDALYEMGKLALD